MTELSALWLPILLAAVFVFVVSAVIQMGPFWHRSDFPPLPDENRARASIGALQVPPGEYMLPRCDTLAESRSQEFLQKMNEGPVLMLTVRPNGMPDAITESPITVTVGGGECGPGATARSGGSCRRKRGGKIRAAHHRSPTDHAGSGGRGAANQRKPQHRRTQRRRDAGTYAESAAIGSGFESAQLCL